MFTRLGQNFLINEGVAKLLVSCLNVPKNIPILEIGSGKGILTKQILDHGYKVIAVEKDVKLVEGLKMRFENEIKTKQMKIIQEDVRSFNLPKFKYAVISNIPFYITGSLIKKLLTSKYQPIAISLLIQKEVAYRIAKDKKESVLSLSVKFYGSPKYIKTIKRGNFSPKPKVDSAIISIVDIKERSISEEKTFFSFIKSAFTNKRKKLCNNLNNKNLKTFYEFAKKKNIDVNIRAEDIEYSTWEELLL